MVTKYGVYYDLEKSIYRLKVNNYEFVFSSQLHKEKFRSKLIENRSIINQSLSKRFGFKIVNNDLCDILLYRKVETRGFLIYDKKGDAFCLNNIRLDGQITISKMSTD